ncbi:MAG: DUF5053 domain-containing protein, partial [Prevotellaceae bacterium]|nr:DUF5053 domain-containing protein [Prevotellaceae bacterium]
SGFNQKSESEKEAFCRAFEEGAEEAINRADALINYVNVKRNLQEILNIMPISYISETYFKRSRSWLSQRLNGNLVNGLPVSLTPNELKILSDALNDISDKIKTAARSIA